eukprot:gene22767-biopygen8214
MVSRHMGRPVVTPLMQCSWASPKSAEQIAEVANIDTPMHQLKYLQAHHLALPGGPLDPPGNTKHPRSYKHPGRIIRASQGAGARPLTVNGWMK